jgi:hypothetical protein
MADYVRLEGVEDLLKKIESLESLEGLKEAMSEAAASLRTKLQEAYPPERRLKRSAVYPAPWKSKKQRRYFFWALKHGKIQVPYQRGSSGGQSFKESWVISAQNNGLTQVIENTTTYGPLLMGKDNQTLYMKRIGWGTTEAVMEEEQEEVRQQIGTKLAALLK